MKAMLEPHSCCGNSIRGATSPLIEPLGAWSENHGLAIKSAQRRFDPKNATLP
jgi:hypothetical protein